MLQENSFRILVHSRNSLIYDYHSAMRRNVTDVFATFQRGMAFRAINLPSMFNLTDDVP